MFAGVGNKMFLWARGAWESVGGCSLKKSPKNLIKQYIRPPKNLARVDFFFCPQPKPPKPPILTFLSPKCIISLHIGGRNAISDTKVGKAIDVSGDRPSKPRLSWGYFGMVNASFGA